MSFRSFTSTLAFAATRLRSQTLQVRSYATEVGLHHDLKPTRFGQPLFASHPHLSRLSSTEELMNTKSDENLSVQPGEITPGISVEEYERRRKALMDRLPADSIVVSVAGQIKYMSGRE